MSLIQFLTNVVSEAFTISGFDGMYGEVVPSKRRDLCQFQCNGALAASKQYESSPREIAQTVVTQLNQSDIFDSVTVAGPGFINLTVNDRFLVNFVNTISMDKRLGYPETPTPCKIVIDYGGANIAKPMHVGHLRAAIIGESIKRLTRFSGNHVLGDIHLGDWGLPMGLVIAELKLRHPDWLYFKSDYTGPYPDKSPVTIDDLEELYPTANRRAQEDEVFMEEARQATVELQNGRPGYYALWEHFLKISIAELERDYADLNVEFDLWLGESDTQNRISPLIEYLCAQGHAYESRGALIVDVSLPEDKHDIPPLILVKSDGAVLYATTDLATVEQRVQELDVELILYVVDKRQSTHFQQVFRAAHKTGVAPLSVEMKHIPFGTMNGKDGKPFKTRAGGVLKLRTLIQMVTDKAKEKLLEAELDKAYSEEERDEIARVVGVAALKFADLVNHRANDYVFDLDRFLLFEGRTGPYLLYTITRARSILQKAAENDLAPGPLQVPANEVERDLLLKLTEFPDALNVALEDCAPNHICEYTYTLSALFNQFYHQCHILNETDPDQQGSWLRLADLCINMITLNLDLLGIQVPPKM